MGPIVAIEMNFKKIHRKYLWLEFIPFVFMFGSIFVFLILPPWLTDLIGVTGFSLGIVTAIVVMMFVSIFLFGKYQARAVEKEFKKTALFYPGTVKRTFRDVQLKSDDISIRWYPGNINRTGTVTVNYKIDSVPYLYCSPKIFGGWKIDIKKGMKKSDIQVYTRRLERGLEEMKEDGFKIISVHKFERLYDETDETSVTVAEGHFDGKDLVHFIQRMEMILVPERA